MPDELVGYRQKTKTYNGFGLRGGKNLPVQEKKAGHISCHKVKRSSETPIERYKGDIYAGQRFFSGRHSVCN